MTPSRVRQLIRRDGAGQALRWLSEDPEVWSGILDGVSSGDVRWLEIAAQLRLVSDGGLSLALELSIQDALLAAPVEVLRVVAAQSVPVGRSPGFTVEGACDGYGSGSLGDEPPTAAELKAIRESLLARIDVVRRIDDPMLSDVRSACLRQLEALAEDIRESDGGGK